MAADGICLSEIGDAKSLKSPLACALQMGFSPRFPAALP